MSGLWTSPFSFSHLKFYNLKPHAPCGLHTLRAPQIMSMAPASLCEDFCASRMTVSQKEKVHRKERLLRALCQVSPAVALQRVSGFCTEVLVSSMLVPLA